MKSILVITLFVSLGIQQLGCATSADNATDHYKRGVGLQDKGDLEGAIAEYRTALRLNPNDVAAHYNLGVTLKAKGDFVLAGQELEAALRLIPQTPENQARIKTIQSILSDLDKPQPSISQELPR